MVMQALENIKRKYRSINYPRDKRPLGNKIIYAVWRIELMGKYKKGVICAFALLFAQGAIANDYNWIIRTNITNINPDADTNSLGLSIDDDTAVSVDITRFFTPHIAANLVAVFTSHEASSAACGGTGSCGNFDLLPPIITAQYHFQPDADIRPYVGAGINFNRFSDETGTLAAIATDIDNEIGYVLGAGVDFGLTDSLAINVDIKKIFLDVSVSTTLGSASFDVDPWVIGAGIAYRF